MTLTSPVTAMAGVGSIIATKLDKLAIRTVFDFLYHLPFRYEDRSLISPIDQLQPGETVGVLGRLTALKNVFTRRGRALQLGEVSDATGTVKLVWFNQTYLTRVLKVGQTYTFFGRVDIFSQKLSLISPEHEQGHLHTGRIVPIYPETAGLSSKWFRTKVQELLDVLPDYDFLPANTQALPWKQALRQVHFPENLEVVNPARKRLAFDELFLLQLNALVHKQAWAKTKLANRLTIDLAKIDAFRAALPFKLTPSQQQAVSDILMDLQRDQPMNRLLEGDVGSGKTIVAAVAAYVAHTNDYQTLLMAPTQILAQQHYQTLKKLFDPLNIEVGLVTSQTKNITSRSTVVVGTHAMLTAKTKFDRVGLVVIDEQHRFGVTQRARATAKGEIPHVLTMTATPIPRTIALTLYGDLDLSQLTELPSGRQPVKTWIVPEAKRTSAYDWIAGQLQTGNSQAFWVCPFINESESMQTVKAASVEFAKLQEIFPQFSLGLLHGKLSAAQKMAVLEGFRAGRHQILVTTPVVEVGIDVPAATIMVIETADRFGLAQLHQLRGRVGRGEKPSFCLLFTDQVTTRLKAMETHHLGVELAQIDMQLRGPGDIYGTAQHGVPGFKVATYDDAELIELARQAALAAIDQLPHLALLRELLEKDTIGLVQPN